LGVCYFIVVLFCKNSFRVAVAVFTSIVFITDNVFIYFFYQYSMLFLLRSDESEHVL